LGRSERQFRRYIVIYRDEGLEGVPLAEQEPVKDSAPKTSKPQPAAEKAILAASSRGSTFGAL
jgi:hypothetical protein